MGNYGEGGIGDNGYETHIANGFITVPESIWKVIVVIEHGDNDLQRVNNNTRVIAVDMPNEQSVAGFDWDIFRVSVDELEAKTGLDFMSRLSEDLQMVLEESVDEEEI